MQLNSREHYLIHIHTLMFEKCSHHHVRVQYVTMVIILYALMIYMLEDMLP